jgi:hypothetical protein
MELLKAEHAADLGREAATVSRLEARLDVVRRMRDRLLAAHQSTEMGLSQDNRTLRVTVDALYRDVEAIQRNVAARKRVRGPRCVWRLRDVLFGLIDVR